MARFDLAPYGIDKILTPTFDVNTIDVHSFATGYHDVAENGKDIATFTIRGLSYDVLERMGAGTYGTTYKVRSREDRKEYAIKHIHGNLSRRRDLIVFAKEAIIQILLVEESKKEVLGPYAPILYEIAYDPQSKQGYIRSEIMRNTFENLAIGLSPEDNNIVIPDALIQAATALKFFGDRLQFNHRDFKGDNLMYVRIKNKRIYKLIDFGFSCLTWHGLKINGGDYFAASPTCFKVHRDLSQMMYYIVKFVESVSTDLRSELVALLKTNIGKRSCGLAVDCKDAARWSDTYAILDRKDVTVPHGNPTNVRDAMEDFMHPGLRVKEEVKVLEPVKICPPGKILNPKTGRCVKEDGGVGAKWIEKLAAPADCPPGKIRNPKTRRCVKVDGFAGKQAQKGLPIAAAQLEQPLAVPDCPPGKIRNPKTRRCVKVDGFAGKQAQKLFPAF